MRSPLGKYSAIAASVAAIGILAAYVVGLLFAGVLGVEPTSVRDLKDLALIAAGAVFAAGAPATNGAQAIADQLGALHARLDAAHVPAAGTVDPPRGT